MALPIACVALLSGIAAFAQDFTVVETLEKNARQADAYLGMLCEDSAKLRQRPSPFREPGTARDAAAFMAPLMDYEIPYDDPPGRLHLKAELAERLKSYGPHWPLRIGDADLAGLDFRWLAELRQFDHWSVLGAGRLRDLPPGRLFVEAIPSYGHLMYWAKLRFALGFRRSDLPAAVAEVRHLTMLVRSQRLLISESVALALSRFEARARQVAVAAGEDVSWWAAPDTDRLELEGRTVFASVYFAYPGVREATLRKAVTCAPSPCVMLIEGAIANRMLANGPGDNSGLIGTLFPQYGCEPAVLERIRQSRKATAGEALESARNDLGDWIATHLEGP